MRLNLYAETTNQSSEYCAKCEARPKKLRQSGLKTQLILIVCFDYPSVVHYKFLSSGETVNKKYLLCAKGCQTCEKTTPGAFGSTGKANST